MKTLVSFLFIILPFTAWSQNPTVAPDDSVFSFREYLAMVKMYHPVVSQANLKLSAADAALLEARGLFDPVINGSVSEKNFDGTHYYTNWHGTFTVPTWYGIDLKADYDQGAGYYLNPQNTTPDDGIWSAGVNIRLAEGLIYNQRMNAVKQAKILQDKNENERNIIINSILAEASRAYIEWKYYYENKKVYQEFLENARIRLEGISRSSELGETRALDTLETRITVRNRKLALNQANLNLQKAQLKLSSYLWVEDVPVQLEEQFVPNISRPNVFDVLGIQQLKDNAENLARHPELQSMKYTLQAQRLDIRLQRNKLLPKVDVYYNFLTSEPRNPGFNTDNYKFGVKVQMPLFLRSERGKLQSAQIKFDNTQFALDDKRWSLTNTIRAAEVSIDNIRDQLQTIRNIVDDNQVMVAAEIRLFNLGESSIFLINTRENRLIDAKLQQNQIQNDFFNAATDLFEKLRLTPEMY